MPFAKTVASSAAAVPEAYMVRIQQSVVCMTLSRVFAKWASRGMFLISRM